MSDTYTSEEKGSYNYYRLPHTFLPAAATVTNAITYNSTNLANDLAVLGLTAFSSIVIGDAVVKDLSQTKKFGTLRAMMEYKNIPPKTGRRLAKTAVNLAAGFAVAASATAINLGFRIAVDEPQPQPVIEQNQKAPAPQNP